MAINRPSDKTRQWQELLGKEIHHREGIVMRSSPPRNDPAVISPGISNAADPVDIEFHLLNSYLAMFFIVKVLIIGGMGKPKKTHPH